MKNIYIVHPRPVYPRFTYNIGNKNIYDIVSHKSHVTYILMAFKTAIPRLNHNIFWTESSIVMNLSASYSSINSGYSLKTSL